MLRYLKLEIAKIVAGNSAAQGLINPLKPEFTIAIFIHYKPRIAVAILALQWMKMIRSE